MTESLRVICTGGTLDKQYEPLTGELVFGQSGVPALLGTARIETPVTELLQIDSLDMTDEHRQQVLTCCSEVSERQLVITHGTDTMVDTAQVLAAADLGKTIVLTGAMVPACVTGSDAAFNLGFAIAAARLAKPGVWVAMNATVFAWDQVRKDRQHGLFVAR
jgi:L-asparaginase